MLVYNLSSLFYILSIILYTTECINPGFSSFLWKIRFFSLICGTGNSFFFFFFFCRESICPARHS